MESNLRDVLTVCFWDQVRERGAKSLHMVCFPRYQLKHEPSAAVPSIGPQIPSISFGQSEVDRAVSTQYLENGS
jgi:hypothetical protein